MAWHPLRNLGLKFTALVLSVALWFTVSGRQIERRVPVPVSYSNVPSPLEMTGDQVDVVNVHLRGGDNVVSDLGPGALRVIVDLGDAHSGTNLIPLRTDEVVAPLGVDVIQVEPGTVTVTLERSGSMVVPVTPTVGGEPAPGYVVRSISTTPAAVAVIGPVSLLQDPITVLTERVSLDGRTESVVQDVRVGVTNARLRVDTPRTVRVSVQIQQESSSQ
jgi:YbbR domain-containing protein